MAPLFHLKLRWGFETTSSVVSRREFTKHGFKVQRFRGSGFRVFKDKAPSMSRGARRGLPAGSIQPQRAAPKLWFSSVI